LAVAPTSKGREVMKDGMKGQGKGRREGRDLLLRRKGRGGRKGKA